MFGFGILLFIVGSALVVWAGFIGVDVGSTLGVDAGRTLGMEGRRVVNFGGLLGGGSLMVSGAVFTIGGYLGEMAERQARLLDDGFEDLRVMTGYQMEKIPEVVERRVKRPLFLGTRKTFVFMGKSFRSKEAAERARAQFIEKYGRP